MIAAAANFPGKTYLANTTTPIEVNGDNGDEDIDIWDTTTIVDLFEPQGITYKVYEEDYPTSGKCWLGGGYGNETAQDVENYSPPVYGTNPVNRLYKRKHNPFISFKSFTNSNTRCAAQQNFDDFYNNVLDGTLPMFSYVVPTQAHDNHDVTVAYTAEWYGKFVSDLLASPLFLTSRVLVHVVYDEDDLAYTYYYNTPVDDYSNTNPYYNASCVVGPNDPPNACAPAGCTDLLDCPLDTNRNRVYSVLFGSAIPSSAVGTSDDTHYNHASIVATMCANWGLGSLNRKDRSANVFSFTNTGSSSSSSSSSNTTSSSSSGSTSSGSGSSSSGSGSSSSGSGSSNSGSSSSGSSSSDSNTLSDNLLSNGDAETHMCTDDWRGQTPVPGWQVIRGAASVLCYTAFGYTNVSLSLPSSGGSSGLALFAGPGIDTAITQTVNVSAAADAIDSNSVTATLSGWLGGWRYRPERALLTATFLDEAGQATGNPMVVMGPSQGWQTALFSQSSTGSVPAGTRSILVTLDLPGSHGSYQNSYADNLSLTLQGLGSTKLPVTPAAEIPAATVPQFDNVYLVMMENTNYADVVMMADTPDQKPTINPAMPYFASLANSGVLLTDSWGTYHPSDQNYVAMVAGNTYRYGPVYFPDYNLTVTHLGDLLEAKGMTLKA